MIPILKIGESENELMVIDDQWAVRIAFSGQLFRGDDMIMPLLPLLKQPISQLKTRLEAALRDSELEPNLLAAFPFDLIIEMGLNWPTDFWVSQALNWLAEMKDRSNFDDVLRSIYSKKTLPQALRHRALRMLPKVVQSPVSPWESELKRDE